MKYLLSAGLAAGLWMLAAAGHAQISILPPQCAGKIGEALDQCVRQITPPQRSQRVEPVEQEIDPRQTMNCVGIIRADQDFCIARNEIILECRKGAKYPDFDKCVAERITRPPAPGVADCTRAKPDARNECFARNKVYKDCLNDPLRYFICLGKKTSGKK